MTENFTDCFTDSRFVITETPCIEDIVCIDPYAKAVATYQTYFSPRRAIVVKEGNYDWEGDEWIQSDWRDLIIYEMHIRDMTEHQSSGSKRKRNI